jgi:hypothetical protein
MPIVKINSFMAGEINPNLTEAVSNPLYFNSALKIEDMYISKTQTLKRMPSTEEISFNPATTNAYKKMISAKYNDISYVIGIRVSAGNTLFAVYKFNKTTSKLDIVAEHTLTGVTQDITDFVVFDNRVVFTYIGRSPIILRFTETTPTTIDNFIFVNQPTIDFGNVDYSTFEFIVPTNTVDDATIVIKVTGTNVTTLINQNWIGGMVFSLGDNTSEYLGQGKITSIVIDTTFINITVSVLHSFVKGKFKGVRIVLQQPIFFNESNMPSRVGFFQSRLYFANTLLLPMLITGSRINIINDFNIGKGLPAESIVNILNDSTSSEIRHITGYIALFIHTDTNERVVIPSISGSLTHDDFNIQKLSDWGSDQNKPILYNNSIIFTNKTSRKILKIVSNSMQNFTLIEVTKGMDITNDITGIGVIDDPLVDTKLLAFTYLNNTRMNLVTFQDQVFGLTKYDYFPNAATNISGITFGEINNKTLMIGIKSDSTQPILSLFSDITTGLTQVNPIAAPITEVPAFNKFYFNSTNGAYLFGVAGASITVPTGFDFSGFQSKLLLKSVPLVDENANAWDRKEISYLFCSYFKSARFLVNGIPVAFPSIEEVASTSVVLKTNYSKIPSSTKVDKFNYIEISSDQPYPVEITAIGYSIKSTIIT